MYDIPMFKIIIFGKESVGKANFIQRSLTEMFSSKTKMTIGVELYGPKVVSVDGQKVKLQAWDFSGEERFRIFSSSYIIGTQGSLILFDVKDPSSIARIDDWLNIIQKGLTAGIKFPILLVGIVTEGKNKREVSTEEVLKIAKSKSLNLYIECNLETGKNVEKVFEDLARMILEGLTKVEYPFLYCPNCKKTLTIEKFLNHPCVTTGTVSVSGAMMGDSKQRFS